MILLGVCWGSSLGAKSRYCDRFRSTAKSFFDNLLLDRPHTGPDIHIIDILNVVLRVLRSTNMRLWKRCGRYHGRWRIDLLLFHRPKLINTGIREAGTRPPLDIRLSVRNKRSRGIGIDLFVPQIILSGTIIWTSLETLSFGIFVHIAERG